MSPDFSQLFSASLFQPFNYGGQFNAGESIQRGGEKGAAVGGFIGSFAGPIGTAAGSLIGKTIGGAIAKKKAAPVLKNKAMQQNNFVSMNRQIAMSKERDASRSAARSMIDSSLASRVL